jgi:hypothetical protein
MKNEAIKLIKSLDNKVTYGKILKEIKDLDHESIKDKAIKNIENLSSDATYEDILKAIESANIGNVWRNKRGRWFFAISGIFSLISLFILTRGIEITNGVLNTPIKHICEIDCYIYGTWLIFPPLWFLYEYVWEFDDYLKLEPKSHSDFKFTQELASKFWAALLILFGLIIYIKYGTDYR